MALANKPLEDFILDLRQKDWPFGRKLNELFARLDGVDLFAETADARRAVGQMLIRLNARPEDAGDAKTIPVKLVNAWLGGVDHSIVIEQSIIIGMITCLAKRLKREAPAFKTDMPPIPHHPDVETTFFVGGHKPG